MNSLVFFSFLFVANVRGAPKVVMAGTAAVIGNEIIMVSDAYFSRAVRSLIDDVVLSLEPVASDVLKKTVNRLLFESMVIAEMKATKASMSLRNRAIERWGSIKAKEKRWSHLLSHFGKNENDVIQAIWNFMEVETFVERKVETFTPIITDAEVERYYQQNLARLSSDSLENQRKMIRTFLQKSKVEKSLEEWIRFLREKYAVNNLLGVG